MKKACSVLLSVLLIFTMQLCVFAEAGEIGKTQLKTVVPNTHEITVTYNDGGYVLKDGNLIASGAKFAVDRFDSLSLGAVAKLDSHLERVTVNGKDYTGKLQYGMLRFDSVTTNMNIVFTFKNASDPQSRLQIPQNLPSLQDPQSRQLRQIPQAQQILQAPPILRAPLIPRALQIPAEITKILVFVWV